ncbi:hypothetical protein GLOIN_2v1472582 [Rhizophagus irregularis DAOM 181602=DAOM 197198]|nr:hypothetical protein GLOIN_2v1472582 [Rhizophagus irregularis DAOM 181602=DAOM 197198]
MLMRKLLLNDEVDAKLIDDKEINVKCIEADKKETEVDVIDVDVKLIDDDEIDMKCIKADKKETEVDVVDAKLIKIKIDNSEGQHEFITEGNSRICKDCIEEIGDGEIPTEERLKWLLEICEKAEISITEREMLRLISMRYTDSEILNVEFIKLFQENKNELEKNKRSGKYSEDSNEMDNEEETDESVKVGEILNPEDDEYSDEYNLEKEPEK